MKLKNIILSVRNQIQETIFQFHVYEGAMQAVLSSVIGIRSLLLGWEWRMNLSEFLLSESK